jgi:hypothetical protein
MGDLENALKALQEARRRKENLKRQIKALYEQYKKLKAEIELHKQRIENLMSANEYSEFLDTIKIDTSFEFPIPSDQTPTVKKKN